MTRRCFVRQVVCSALHFRARDHTCFFLIKLRLLARGSRPSRTTLSHCFHFMGHAHGQEKRQKSMLHDQTNQLWSEEFRGVLTYDAVWSMRVEQSGCTNNGGKQLANSRFSRLPRALVTRAGAKDLLSSRHHIRTLKGWLRAGPQKS